MASEPGENALSASAAVAELLLAARQAGLPEIFFVTAKPVDGSEQLCMQMSTGTLSGAVAEIWAGIRQWAELLQGTAAMDEVTYAGTPHAYREASASGMVGGLPVVVWAHVDADFDPAALAETAVDRGE